MNKLKICLVVLLFCYFSLSAMSEPNYKYSSNYFPATQVYEDEDGSNSISVEESSSEQKVLDKTLEKRIKKLENKSSDYVQPKRSDLSTGGLFNSETSLVTVQTLKYAHNELAKRIDKLERRANDQDKVIKALQERIYMIERSKK